MVTAKEAVQISTRFLIDLIPDGKDVRLEQITPQEDDWEVVLSFASAETPSLLQLGQPKREFKAIDVDGDSREAIALKVWKV